MFFDPMYFIFLAPALILAGYAQIKVKRTFSKYSKVAGSQGLTGAEAAHMMLERQGISGIRIEPIQGMLSDHYDPRNKVLRLSPKVYGNRSLSALGVACHEAGHAIQDANGYAPLKLRSAMVPATNIGSKLSWVVIFAGFILNQQPLIGVGIALFSLVVLFSLVTLPVEWDASRRAKLALADGGILSTEETMGASKVLNAAFLTYLASAISAVLTLLYYLYRSGLLGGRR